MSEATPEDADSREPISESSVLDLIREIRASEVDPAQISPDDRRRSVQHLGAEGLSVAEIAQVLHRSERTIARDRRRIQEDAAIEADPKLGGILAGRLTIELETAISRVRRVTRDRETPAAVRVEGERACFEMVNAYIDRLQRLGLAPSAAARIEADLTHHRGELPALDEIAAEAARLRAMSPEIGGGEPEELRLLEEELVRARLAERVATLEIAAKEGANDDLPD